MKNIANKMCMVFSDDAAERDVYQRYCSNNRTLRNTTTNFSMHGGTYCEQVSAELCLVMENQPNKVPLMPIKYLKMCYRLFMVNVELKKIVIDCLWLM